MPFLCAFVCLLSTAGHAGNKTAWKWAWPSQTGMWNTRGHRYSTIMWRMAHVAMFSCEKNTHLNRSQHQGQEKRSAEKTMTSQQFTYRKMNGCVNALCFSALPLAVSLKGWLRALETSTAHIADFCFLTCHSIRLFNEHFPAVVPERKTPNWYLVLTKPFW